MILIYAIIVLIVVALLSRRDLSAIGRLSYRGGWVVPGLIVALFFLQAMMVIFVPGKSTLQMLMLILSQLALVFLFLLNRHIPGAVIFAIGITLNLAVMVANGGWMPLTPETSQYIHPDREVELYSRPINSKNIILPKSETNLWILSDIIRITLPWRSNAISAGDVLLILGVAQLLFQATSKRGRQSLLDQTIEQT